MTAKGIRRVVTVAAALIVLSFVGTAPAVLAASATLPVNDTQREPVRGEVPSAVDRATDEGVLPGSFNLEHIQVLMRRPASARAGLDQLEVEQRTRGSLFFQKWLTPADLPKYGPAPEDLAVVTDWLRSHGLRVNGVSPSRMAIDVSGSAAQIAATFGTEVHRVQFRGESHLANLHEPTIPAALSSMIQGVTLNNFFPAPTAHVAGSARQENGSWKAVGPEPTFTFPFKNFLKGVNDLYLLTPGDIATIYDILPARTGLFSPPLTGKEQTVAILVNSDFRPKDWQAYRDAFGLSGYPGTLRFTHPGCQDPGINGDVSEAALDAELVTAVAPAANILMATCTAGDDGLAFGIIEALQNLVELGTSAQVISVSYAGCERFPGPTYEAQWTNAVQEAALEGISIFVGAGDHGPAACDETNYTDPAKRGLGANGLATPPYVTAVGGTDFEDVALGTQKEYWLPKNRPNHSSALSYIPEIPWDSTCASSIIAAYRHLDPVAFCNETGAYSGTLAAGGGASGIFAKPDWQTLSLHGVPDDGARDTPDISMFADSAFGHYYLICQSDSAIYGGSYGGKCDYSKRRDVFFQLAGGTSASTPLLAGIAALIDQWKAFITGRRLPVRIGNMAPRLYELASAEFATGFNLSQCNAARGNRIGSTCTFHNVTQGDTAVPCVIGSPYCYGTRESIRHIGILATRPGGNTPAYPAHPGYSLATGLGSVDVTNLIIAY